MLPETSRCLWLLGAAALAGVAFVAADIMHGGGAVARRRRPRAELVEELAAELHEAWRQPRRRPATGDYEPRPKPTTDEAWIARQGRSEVDIANTAFRDLPRDWQAENRAAAEDALEYVAGAAEREESFDMGFVERTAGLVHERWRRRNAGRASPELDRPYIELAEAEKEKDRQIVRSAIAIWVKG